MRARRKRNIVIGALCGSLLLMSVGYAAFNSTLNIKGTSSISSNWDISITNVVSKNIVGEASNATEPTWDDLTASMEANLTNPGDSIEYDVTIENRGTLNAKLEKVTLSDAKNSAIKFTSSGIKEGEVLNAGSSVVLTIKIEYDKNVTGQPGETTSELNVTLDYVQSDESGVTPSGPSASDTLIENVVTEGDGLYADTYEPGRYMYKGTDPSNYITFSNQIWRIISVESDGTLKIMKKDSIGNRVVDTTGGAYGLNDWARPADLNTYLNVTYYNDNTKLSEEAKSLIQSHTWPIGGVITYNADLPAQIISENGTTWTGNIGLISVSEYLRANTNMEQCGNFKLNENNYYICNKTNYIVPKSDFLWTISPLKDEIHAMWSVSFEGDVMGFNANDDDSFVHPVVYLKSDITLSGSGTLDDPFVIE